MIETLIIIGLVIFTTPLLGFFVENYLRDDEEEEIMLEEDVVIRRQNSYIWF
jgi:hypothetical protein